MRKLSFMESFMRRLTCYRSARCRTRPRTSCWNLPADRGKGGTGCVLRTAGKIRIGRARLTFRTLVTPSTRTPSADQLLESWAPNLKD